MGGAHELIEPVPDQRPLNLQQPCEHTRPHQAPFTRCSILVRRASIRSTLSRTPSTPRMNSSSSVFVTRSPPSSCRYSAIFSPALPPPPPSQLPTLFPT